MTDHNARDHTTTPAGARGHDHTETDHTETTGTANAEPSGPPVTGPVVGMFVMSLLFLSLAFVCVPGAEHPRPGVPWLLVFFFSTVGALTAGVGVYAETERRAR